MFAVSVICISIHDKKQHVRYIYIEYHQIIDLYEFGHNSRCLHLHYNYKLIHSAHPNSAHPKHTFSGIVYSGCFRLRKIVNNQDRLEKRLQELGHCFKNAGYPESLTKNIIHKALASERCLKRKSEKTQIEECATPSIRVVSTYGSDVDLVNSVKRFASSLSRTRSFSESDISDPERSDILPLTSTPSHHLSVPNVSGPGSRSPNPSLSISGITTPSTDADSPNVLTQKTDEFSPR